MKNTNLLAAFLIFNFQFSIINCFAQPTEAEQIQTLRSQLRSLEKASKEEQAELQRQIDFLQIGSNDVNELLNTHDIRLMTNKILIQGALEGTIAQIKEEQEATSSGYARTKKIVWAALAAGLFAICVFTVTLTLLHRRNKKNFMQLDKMLWQIKNELDILNRTHEKNITSLKGELSELRHGFDISEDRQQQTMQQARLRMAAIEEAAQAHKKLSEARITSLLSFQHAMEDTLGEIKQRVDSTADKMEKEMSAIEQRIAVFKTKN